MTKNYPQITQITQIQLSRELWLCSRCLLFTSYHRLFTSRHRSVKDLLCVGREGLRVEFGDEALGNALSDFWLKCLGLRVTRRPHLYLEVHYALIAVQLVFGE